MEFVLFKGVDCPPCKTLEAFLKENQVEYTSILATDNPKEAVRRKVRTVPTLLALEDDEEKHRFVGLARLSELKEVIDQTC